MILKIGKALNSFRTGLNCAQSVVTTYSDEFEFDYHLACNLSFGFGGGMGKMQETCGAVAGAFMVLSIFNSKINQSCFKNEENNLSIKLFTHKFKLIHGTINCKSLLNCDLNTVEGQFFIKEHNLRESVCEKCISDSIIILEELLEIKK